MHILKSSLKRKNLHNVTAGKTLFVNYSKHNTGKGVTHNFAVSILTARGTLCFLHGASVNLQVLPSEVKRSYALISTQQVNILRLSTSTYKYMYS